MPEQLPDEWSQPDGWHVLWHPAKKKGYAGVAVWSRHPIREIARGLDSHDDDEEGRVLAVEVGGVQLYSIYLPSGSSGEQRQALKESWMTRFAPWADALRRKRKPIIMGGDFNIAHTEKDIFYAKGNTNNSGFLPHERAWFGDLLLEPLLAVFGVNPVVDQFGADIVE